ncbi:ABC-type branched-chain amino acid transport system, substrate-binding protein [Parafrankia irregularis]|uniref:ABC-type branched-chain amino acid transport system, substrate-binding protein n=1 Tax=Parafrankia irregularis TaxID=795642 RepID=A0A0S4QIL1_9ACTN|nr:MULTISPECIES: ABC transporter substrate-binding protein [Parafrankia]MBE3203788.1 ABC transporter substrate-binding protein [Parafrankia sp. CH37]CUU55345.1 ABC-type branched-chain amino acid transport system, substrate-binding protein [Parafrankia irregularis]
MNKATRILRTVVVGALLAVVAGCGGSSDTSAPEASCSSPGVTADKVEAGVVISDSGSGSDAFSSARAGVNARFRLANANGGVHGRDIEYTWRDDASQPEESVRAANELVQKESVFGILPITTALTGALDGLQKDGVPVVGFALPSWSSYNNLFAYSYISDPTAIGRYFMNAGATKVGFVMTGTAESTTQAAQKYLRAFAAIGLDTTDMTPYVASVDSPTQIMGRLKDVGVDALIGFTVPTDLANLIGAARDIGMPLKATISLTGYDQTVLQSLGQKLAGVSFDVHFRPFESPDAAIDTYRKAMATFSPETQSDQQWAMWGYIYADMFVKGLEVAGDCPTRESFITGLRQVHQYNAGGLIETVDFATNATQPAPCMSFVQINAAGSAFELVNERLCHDGTAGQ